MLQRLMNSEELAQTVLKGFVVDLPNQFHLLQKTLEAGPLEDATRQAHTIKGASATVGGEVVRATAAAMEATGRNGDLETMRSHLAELEAGISELLRVIQQGIQT